MEYFGHSALDGTKAVDDCEKVNLLSLILMYINIPALTPGLHWAETAREFSDDKILLSILRVKTSVVGK
jgi:hypothetical protein